ncbi:MAG: hypothetical protein ACOY31_03580 [Bacillota bacterium]
MSGKNKKNHKNGNKIKFAPGDYDILEKSASKEEKEMGDYTRVTRLFYDEVDPV